MERSARDAGAGDGGVEADAGSDRCPDYPVATEEWPPPVGAVVPDVARWVPIPGNDPEGDGWKMADFWCQGARGEATLLVGEICGLDNSTCVSYADGLLQVWQDTYSARGLVVWGVTVGGLDWSFEDAGRHWEELGATHPWGFDQDGVLIGYTMLPGEPSWGAPAYFVVDLRTMTLLNRHQGVLEPTPEDVFLPYL